MDSTDDLWLKCYLAVLPGFVARHDYRDEWSMTARMAAEFADEALERILARDEQRRKEREDGGR